MRKISALLVFFCLNSFSQACDYPDEWWKPVPEKDLKSWEIPPQAAGPGEVILSKRNELGVFSNFAATRFEMDGDSYASVEGLWQAMKYPEGPDDIRNSNPDVVWPFTRAQVMEMVAFEAKDAGKIAKKNMKALGIKWITYKGKQLDYKGANQDEHYDVIYRAIKAKVEQNPEVQELLMRTKGLKLRPDHDQGENITPAYEYHKILMKIRDN